MIFLQTLRTTLTAIICLLLLAFSCRQPATSTASSLVKREIVDNSPEGIFDGIDTSAAPEVNRRLIRYVEANGASIAPTYQDAVCTVFLERILENFTPLTKAERKTINIATTESLDKLRAKAAPILQGVHHALVASGKGTSVDIRDAQPGDLVQFWYNWGGQSRGHCGVIRSVHPGWGFMTLYSSSQSGNGYGVQNYWIPSEVYVVRLNAPPSVASR